MYYMEFKPPRSLKRTLSKRHIEGCHTEDGDSTRDMVRVLVKRLDDFLDSLEDLLQVITSPDGSPVDLDGA